jgi:hypothetical protein
MSDGIQIGDGYTFQTLNGASSLSIDKPYIPDNNPSALLGVVIPKLPDIPLPPDIPIPPEPDPDLPAFIDPFAVKPRPLQFECQITSLSAASVLQIAWGAVTYTHSVMPLIKRAPFTDHRQAYIKFASVLSAGVTPVNGTDPNSLWMLNGGGYALTGTGRWYVTLTKWDAGNGEFTGGLLDNNLPWLSVVKEDSDQFNKIFVDAGPSLYQNQMNVQKMSGYTAAATGAPTDWGNCHTTYFNPRFFGHHVRVIAAIDSIAAPPCEVSVVQVRAGSSTANEIQQIIFVGVYKSGSVTFSYGGSTSSSFNPSTQSAFDLQQALNAISALNGNVFVQQAGPGVFQVEFTNALKNTDVALLSASSSMTSFTNWYSVFPMAVGSQDIVIPCELNCTELMNKDGVTEAQDPYYVNAATSPVKWANVVNYEDAYAANALSFIPGWATPIIDDTVPRNFTKRLLDYGKVSGCIPEASMFHPFQVQLDSTSGGGSTYSIISGTVNNLVPNGVSTPITVTTGAYFVYIKLPFVTPNFPANNSDFKWEISATMPADTDAFGYVKVANINVDGSVAQFVTGSLWADRIKLGTDTAKYYYSRI